ncbi:MAG: DUF2267 domain-containing protein [Chitinivibrionales bacterium]
MDYAHMLCSVEGLDFIPDTPSAQAAIESVLGMLVSRLDANTAWFMTQSLPPHLSYQKRRGHQRHITTIDIDSYLQGVRKQFGFDARQAQVLINTILHDVKGFLSAEQIRQVEQALPAEWAALVEVV